MVRGPGLNDFRRNLHDRLDIAPMIRIVLHMLLSIWSMPCGEGSHWTPVSARGALSRCNAGPPVVPQLEAMISDRITHQDSNLHWRNPAVPMAVSCVVASLSATD